MNAKWIKCGDTYLYMREITVGVLQEWHPEVQATLRQVYPGTDPMWYVWDRGDDTGGVEKFLTKQEAIKSVESFFLDTLTADSATIE